MSDFAFSAAELLTMRAAQNGHMMDVGTLDRYTLAAADAYGNPNPSWPTGSATICGYRQARPDEILEASDVPYFDASLRLPIGTVIDTKDRFTLTHRHGTAISAIRHEIVGQPQRGPSGLVVRLKVVDDGS
jgi:hypothetical protein